MKYLLLLLLSVPFSACVDEELAFTVEASPVKAEITRLDDLADGSAVFEATFTELDKDGILDQSVGIIATPVVGLALEILSQEQQLLTTVTTDADGRVSLTLAPDRLQSVSRLEWVGTHNGREFRILENL